MKDSLVRGMERAQKINRFDYIIRNKIGTRYRFNNKSIENNLIYMNLPNIHSKGQPAKLLDFHLTELAPIPSPNLVELLFLWQSGRLTTLHSAYFASWSFCQRFVGKMK